VGWVWYNCCELFGWMKCNTWGQNKLIYLLKGKKKKKLKKLLWVGVGLLFVVGCSGWFVILD